MWVRSRLCPRPRPRPCGARFSARIPAGVPSWLGAKTVGPSAGEALSPFSVIYVPGHAPSGLAPRSCAPTIREHEARIADAHVPPPPPPPNEAIEGRRDEVRGECPGGGGVPWGWEVATGTDTNRVYPTSLRWTHVSDRQREGGGGSVRVVTRFWSVFYRPAHFERIRLN